MHNRRTVHILSMWGHASRLLELCLLTLLGLSRLQTAHAQGASATSDDQLVCFVIRTYWGHGDVWGDGSLRTILGSLQAQTDSRCASEGPEAVQIEHFSEHSMQCMAYNRMHSPDIKSGSGFACGPKHKVCS